MRPTVTTAPSHLQLVVHICAALQPRQLYTSSPRSDLAAKQGLGGQLGLLILVGCIAAVGAASLFGGGAGPQTLAEVPRISLYRAFKVSRVVIQHSS